MRENLLVLAALVLIIHYLVQIVVLNKGEWVGVVLNLLVAECELVWSDRACVLLLKLLVLVVLKIYFGLILIHFILKRLSAGKLLLLLVLKLWVRQAL